MSNEGIDLNGMTKQLQKHLDHMVEMRYSNESALLGAVCACVHALMVEVLILANHVCRLEESAKITLAESQETRRG